MDRCRDAVGDTVMVSEQTLETFINHMTEVTCGLQRYSGASTGGLNGGVNDHAV